jgi:hypothetical protein
MLRYDDAATPGFDADDALPASRFSILRFFGRQRAPAADASPPIFSRRRIFTASCRHAAVRLPLLLMLHISLISSRLIT